MKKGIPLLFAVILCLGLVSCGNSKYAKYEEVINALEEERYEDAVSEIYRLYLKNNGKENSDKADKGEALTTPEVEMWQERAVGEYKAYSYDENKPLQNILLNADGTCTVEGKNYTWDFEKYNGAYRCEADYAHISIMEGDKKIYNFSVYLREEDYVSGDLGVCQEDGSTAYVRGVYYNLNDLMVVELTLDNWQEYFEVVETVDVYKNSFDEITEMSIRKYYLLKEEYGYVNTYFTKVAIEHTSQQVRQMITVDPENQTYTWGEVTHTYDPSSPITSSMCNLYINDKNYFGTQISETYVSTFPESETYQYINYGMTRLKGELYCVPQK